MYEGKLFRYKKSKTDKPTGRVKESCERGNLFWIYSENGVKYSISEVDILWN